MTQRILCIHEDPDLTDFVRDTLLKEEQEYKVLVRRSPFHDVTEIKMLHPDLILLTVTPDANCLGRQTLRLLARSPASTFPPLLAFFSTAADILPQDQDLKQEYISFLCSPSNITDVVQSIKQALSTRFSSERTSQSLSVHPVPPTLSGWSRRHIMSPFPQEQGKGLLEPGANRMSVFIQTGQMLAELLQVFDAHVSAHCARVGRLAEETGRYLGVSSEALFLMRLGGFCHDLGKLGIPNAILWKPGALLQGEWNVMQLHPEIGARILGHMGGLFQWVAPVAQAHHERWDGQGYPQGLKGEAIPLASRVIAVVDTYDAMMSSRPYKEPNPIAAIEAELCRCAGTQFDPDIVRAFLSVLKRPNFHWSHLQTSLDWEALVQTYAPVLQEKE